MDIKATLKETLGTVMKFEKQHRATILCGLGVAGLWATAWKAFKAGPVASKIIAEKRKDMEDVRPGDKKARRTVAKEAVVELAPVLAPPILLGGVSTACIIGSNTVSNRKIATLSAAYTITDNAFREHKEKFAEILGEKRAQQVREAVSRDHVQNNPPPEDESKIVTTGTGDVLCYDEYSGRYFYSNAEKIGEAIIKLSHDIQTEMTICLNDFYYEIGLPFIKMGDEFGWNVDHTERGMIPIHYTATMTPDKRPCIAVQFELEPLY